MKKGDMDLEDVMGGNVSFSIVDKLDKLRDELASSTMLSKKIGRTELLNIIDDILDSLPAELRTARSVSYTHLTMPTILLV